MVGPEYSDAGDNEVPGGGVETEVKKKPKIKLSP